MYFKQITLQNFRQFKEKTTVTFSTDHVKNVTIIMGDNGTGKTSFAQAFTWCLYGRTDFKDQDIFSKSKKAEMTNTDTAETFVELVFVHGDIEYTLKRSLVYKKDLLGDIIKPRFSECVLTYKKEDGQTETIKSENKLNKTIDGILPRELSRYFLFDGERVEKMSAEIQSGKSDEFAEAVRRILGLDSYLNALIHIKSDPKKDKGRMRSDTVLGKYNKQYSDSGNESVSRLTEEISALEIEMQGLNNRKDELEAAKPIIQQEYDKLTEQIVKNKEGEEIAKKKAEAERKIERLSQIVDNSAKDIFSHLSKDGVNYFSQHLIARAIKMLAETDAVDKGVPSIDDKTIDYIFKHHRCICGTEIKDGSPEEKELNLLLNYIPPKSLGNMIGSYITEGRARITGTTDLYEYVANKLRSDTENIETIDDLRLDIENYDAQLDNVKDIEQLRLKQRTIKIKQDNDEQEIREIITRINEIESEIKIKDSRRKELSLQDETNKKIAIYRSYAEAAYDYIEKEYSSYEKGVREYLEECINRIFLNIYSEGLSLNIDSKYNVKIRVNDVQNLQDEVETSTSQSISVVFAFITGVIETAKKYEQDKKEKKLTTEPYPLVMDAPLSAFDKKRIKTVCDTIPEICEQVIIFIKDTDGEIAHEHLSGKIGSSYLFRKVTSVETEIKEAFDV